MTPSFESVWALRSAASNARRSRATDTDPLRSIQLAARFGAVESGDPGEIESTSESRSLRQLKIRAGIVRRRRVTRRRRLTQQLAHSGIHFRSWHASAHQRSAAHIGQHFARFPKQRWTRSPIVKGASDMAI